MRGHYEHYEISILQQILQSLIPDDEAGNILKDLLTIPETRTLRGYTLNGMLSYRERKKPSDPADLGELRNVHSLVSQIIIFIEDYVSKATSLFPPRAYLGVPDLEWGTGSKFKGQSLDTKLVPFTSLSRSERYRLLRAFVRYEMLCRIYRALPLRPIAHYYGDFDRFNACGKGPSSVDKLAFLSAYDYYRAMFGAMFAHCGNAGLPELSTLSQTRRRLVYPDNMNMFFDADSYYKDLSFDTGYNPELLDGLTCLGLDLVIRFVELVRPGNRGGSRGRRFVRLVISKFQAFPPWIYELSRTQDDRGFSQNFWDWRRLVSSSNPESPSLRSFLAANARVHERFGRSFFEAWEKAYMRQVQIYRQRAWGMLNDKRLYADGTHPWPTIQQIENLERPSWLKESLNQTSRGSQLLEDLWAANDSPEQFWYLAETREVAARTGQWTTYLALS